jgi:hypothetical protein
MRLVDPDAIEPGEELGVALEASDAPPGPDERLLRRLLGLLAMAEEPEDHRVEPVRVAADKGLERRAVAALRAQDELGVRIAQRPHRE